MKDYLKRMSLTEILEYIEDTNENEKDEKMENILEQLHGIGHGELGDQLVDIAEMFSLFAFKDSLKLGLKLSQVLEK